MNFPKIWKFLTPLILGFLLPEYGWIPVVFLVLSTAFASANSVLVSLILWSFSALSTREELPLSPWKNPCLLRVEIIGNVEKKTVQSVEAIILQGNVKPGFRVLLKLPKSETQGPKEGEHYWVRGTAEWPSEPRNKNQFSTSKFLKSKGLNALVKVNKGGFVCLKEADLHNQTPKSLGKAWAEKIQKHSPAAETGYLIRALLLGDKRALSKSLKDAFKKTGLSHLLAVSGLHVAILFAGLNLLLRLLPGKRTGVLALKALLLSVALLSYCWLTGFSPSVLRASLMLGIAQWYVVIRRPTSGIHKLGLAVFFLLALSPEMLKNGGFQLSVLAVGGILIIEPMLRIYRPSICPSWAWSALTVSFSAQLATAPLMLSWGGAFPTWFLFTNLLAIPITTVFIYLSVVWLLAVLVFGSHPKMDDAVSWLGTLYLDLIRWMGNWPASTLVFPNPDTWGLMLAYGILISVVWKMASKSQWPYYWIALLVFIGWARHEMHLGEPQHLVIQASNGPPILFLWNEFQQGEGRHCSGEQLPVNVNFQGKSWILTQRPVALEHIYPANAILWLNRKHPPVDWLKQLPDSIEKFSLQDYPPKGWKSLTDSTDLVLY